jgi:hypothetical protein
LNNFGYWELRKSLLFVQQRLIRRDLGRVRFGYIGAHQKGNLGDDALFLAARRLMACSCLLTYGPPPLETVFARLGLSGSKYLNAVILGGGTLINPLWTEQVRDALEKGIPVWTLGTGVGSCGFEQDSVVGIDEWRGMLPIFKGISVRGPRSQKALEDLGIGNVRVTGDLGLSLARENPSPLAGRPRIGLSLTVHPGRHIEDYVSLRQIHKIVVGLVRDGWEPVPILLHPSDVRPTREFLEGLPMHDLSLPALKNIDELFDRIGSCNLTIAGRLHAAVLSCCVGVPPLKIVYRDKCLDFMESMDLPDWCIGLTSDDQDAIGEITRRAIGRAPEVREPVLEHAQKWKKITENYVNEMVERSGDLVGNAET